MLILMLCSLSSGTTAFVIRRGGLRVEVALPGASEREGEQFSIAYGAGEIVGELSLLYHSLRGATVTAVAETEVFVIDADAFNAVVSLKRVFSKRAQLCRFLRRVSLVRGAHIDLDAINHLADALVAREYAAGEVIIREGEVRLSALAALAAPRRRPAASSTARSRPGFCSRAAQQDASCPPRVQFAPRAGSGSLGLLEASAGMRGVYKARR